MTAMFDEEPDGDPHGECRAEIDALRAKLAEAKRLGLEACDMAADAAGVIADWGADNGGEWRDAKRSALAIRTALEDL